MALDYEFNKTDWCLLLHKSLKCLLNPQYRIYDDSVLHLLTDRIKVIVLTEELVQISQIECFITSAINNSSSLDSNVVCFATHLAGWLGETEAWFPRYRTTVERALSIVFTGSGCDRDLGTLTAAYDGLSKIASHKAGLRWILTDSQEPPIIQQSYNLLSSGRSVFLDRGVIRFLVTAWSNSTLWSEEEKIFQKFSEHTLSHVCQVIESSAKNSQNRYLKPDCSRNSQAIPILNQLEEACARSDRLADKIMKCSSLFTAITSLVNTGSGSESRLAVNIMKIFIEKSSTCSISKKIEEFTSELYTRGCIKTAQELSVCLLKKGSRASCLVSQLVEPVKMAISEPTRPMNGVSKHSESEFIDILCHTIVCLEKTGLPASTEVVNLYKMFCNRNQMSTSSKLQRVCLNYFLHVVESGEIDKTVASVIASCVTEVIRCTAVDHQALSLSLKCLVPLLPTLQGNMQLSEELLALIQCHLCAVQWETRDTTLEFLGQVLEKYTGDKIVTDWFISSHLCNHIWQCLSDSDSYVRATAVTCVSKMIPVHTVWQALITQTETEERDIIAKVLHILKTDSEAFPRRAAVRFLQSYYCYKIKVIEQDCASFVMETLTTSSIDFDWEVKLAGLILIENLIKKETAELGPVCEDIIPSYAADLVKRPKLNESETRLKDLLFAVGRLELCGCWKTLFTATEDYDLAVCEKADTILLDVSHLARTVVGKEVTEGKLAELGDILEKLLKQLKEIDSKSVGVIGKKSFSKSHNTSILSSKLHVKQNKSHDFEKTIEDYNSQREIRSFEDINKQKSEILTVVEKLIGYQSGIKLSEKSNYDANPFSLLDDILSYAQKDEDSNVIDCY